MIIWYCLALQAKSAAPYYKDFEIIKIISIQNKVLTMKW